MRIRIRRSGGRRCFEGFGGWLFGIDFTLELLYIFVSVFAAGSRLNELRVSSTMIFVPARQPSKLISKTVRTGSAGRKLRAHAVCVGV